MIEVLFMLGAQSVSDRCWLAKDKPCKIHTSVYRAFQDSNVNKNNSIRRLNKNTIFTINILQN
jgi:hypothetical protein